MSLILVCICTFFIILSSQDFCSCKSDIFSLFFASTHLFLLLPHSILRHSLDKIAEIKSLLEERRIGVCMFFFFLHLQPSFCNFKQQICIYFIYVLLQLLRWREFTATATLPGRRWDAASWWRSCSSRPWRSLCGSASRGKGICCSSRRLYAESFSLQPADSHWEPVYTQNDELCEMCSQFQRVFSADFRWFRDANAKNRQGTNILISLVQFSSCQVFIVPKEDFFFCSKKKSWYINTIKTQSDNKRH